MFYLAALINTDYRKKLNQVEGVPRFSEGPKSPKKKAPVSDHFVFVERKQTPLNIRPNV